MMSCRVHFHGMLPSLRCGCRRRPEGPVRHRSPIKSMNTSSSDAAIGRDAIDADALRRQARPRSPAPAAAAAPAARRTCARSPKDCTSRTPGSEARSSIGGRGSVDDHFEQLAGERRLQVAPGDRARAGGRRAAAPRVRTARPRRDTASPSRSSARFDRNSERSFQNSRRDTGSTPVVGSSRSRICGSCTSVHASASFCFIPPESRSARRARNGVSWVISEQPVSRRLVYPDAVNLGEERDVLVDGEIAVEREPLREVPDVRGDRPVLFHRVAAEHAHLAAVGADQPARQANRRRFARAVRTDDAEHLAGLDRERHVVRRPPRRRTACRHDGTPARSAAELGLTALTWAAPLRPACPSSGCRRGCRRSL